tara:strand:- start:172 stop:576 length:405 start_codon:yes stop_codon:yes gene_type:complete
MRAKFSRMRGTHTHGGGHKKKRRGFGSKGGKGNAGSGKRGDGKKPSYWKLPTGSSGFTRGWLHKKRALNITDLEVMELIEKEGFFMYKGKVLGKGNPTRKYNVTLASARAKEKIEKAGGVVQTDALENNSEQSS